MNWIERYRKSAELAEEDASVFLGFNANLDRIYSTEDLELDGAAPRKHEEVDTKTEMLETVKYCVENQTSLEADYRSIEAPEGGRVRAGGQPAIMSNFLSAQNDRAVFYTPEISEGLAQEMDEDVEVPVVDGELRLRNVSECVNSGFTKENLIFELEGAGRAIFSEENRGLEPFLPQEIEKHLGDLEDQVDRFILSGYHDIEGRLQPRLERAASQLRKIGSPIHLEFVHRNEEYTQMIFEEIVPEVESIGLDEHECRKLSETLEAERIEEFNLREAFRVAEYLVRSHGLSRVHVHSLDFHVCVAEKTYADPEDLRRSMLYGDLCAFQTCRTGIYPSPGDLTDELERSHVQSTQQLEEFGDFMEIEGFENHGLATIKGLDVAAIPPLVSDDPERLVGLGDVISCGAFAGESKTN